MANLPPNQRVLADYSYRELRSFDYSSGLYADVFSFGDSLVNSRTRKIGFRPVFTAFEVMALTSPQAPAAPAAPAAAAKAYPVLPDRTEDSTGFSRGNRGGSYDNDLWVNNTHLEADGANGRYRTLGFRPVITSSAAFDRIAATEKAAAPAKIDQGSKGPTLAPNITVDVGGRRPVFQSRGTAYDYSSDLVRVQAIEAYTSGFSYQDMGFRPVIFASAAFDRLASAQTPAQAAAAIAAPAALGPPDRTVQNNIYTNQRGGGWVDHVTDIRTWYTATDAIDSRVVDAGFRPAFTAFDVLSLTQGAPAAPAVTQNRPLPRAPAPPAPVAPPPPPPPPPPPINAPDATAPLFLNPGVMVVKTAPIPKEVYLKAPFQPMNVPDAAVVAFLSGRNESELKAEMTVYWSNIVDWYCSLIIPVPDQKNYFYLFDYVQTNDYSKHNAAIPFGWDGTNVPAIKTSYGGGYDMELDGKKYWRMHSAGGRSGGNEIFRAVGSVIYPGGAIEYALIEGKAGIYTDSGRTPAATKFWDRAVATGLATRSGTGYSTYEYLPAERAMASVGLVRGPYEPHGRFATMARKFKDAEPAKFASRKKTFDKYQKVKKEIRLVRGEMLARSIFTLSHDSIKTVRDMIVDTGNAGALALFDSRPEIQTHAAAGTLSGLSTALRVRRPMPPIPAHLAGFVADAFNPY